MTKEIAKPEASREAGTRPNSKNKISTAARKHILVLALRKSLGIVSTACERTGVGRTQHYRWMQDDPKYKAEVEAIENIAVDFGESALLKLIRQGCPAATIFFMKTKGKARGYIERHEVRMEGELKTTDVPFIVRIVKDEMKKKGEKDGKAAGPDS